MDVAKLAQKDGVIKGILLYQFAFKGKSGGGYLVTARGGGSSAARIIIVP